MEHKTYKVRVGQLSTEVNKHYDVLLVDKEKNAWQLLLFLGIDARWKLAGRTFHKWLIYHPNGGLEIRNIEANVFVYLDAITEEK